MWVKIMALLWLTSGCYHSYWQPAAKKDAPMKSSKVPHDSFREGFVVGYQLMKGIAAGIPGSPGGPAPHGGTTSFLLGIREGIKAAGGTLNDA
jgi:hypothetical protein